MPDQCTPPFHQWAEVLRTNLANREQRKRESGVENFTNIRSEVLSAATNYTTSLDEIAADAGLTANTVRPSKSPGTVRSLANASDPDSPIVASGHQPVVFHPGILAKNRCLSELIRATDAIGLMICIDTDEGQGGKLRYPFLIEPGRRELRNASLSSSTTMDNLFMTQRVADCDDLASVSETVTNALFQLGFADAAERVAPVLAQFQRLAGQPISIANTIVRRLWEDQPGYLELPLSRLIELPTIHCFIESLVRNAATLHQAYITTLARYRRDHKIRNKANPFPFLAAEETSLELPFWVVDTLAGTRDKLYIDPDEPTIETEPHIRIVPRGMMITAILRLLVSDLFIHGTGGAKYDQCTDEFIKDFFGTEAPAYVSATKTQYLFEPELAQAAKTKESVAKIRDIQTRFQKHVASGTFHGVGLATATDLLSRREQAIERLKEAKSNGQSAAEINRQLKSVDNEIKSFVQQTFGTEQSLTEPTKEELAVLKTRDFPYFFFRNESRRSE